MTSDPIAAGSLLAGRFEVERLANTGGMGDVFRARDRNTGLPVALKFVRHPDPTHLSRFEREARTLAQLQHPAIVRYITHGSEPSVFLAMEWLEGEDLSHRLARGPISIQETLLLAKHVTDALAAAHANGIVHRDIKPSNIFLCNGKIDTPKVVDFGVAQVSQGTRAITGTGQLIGTLGYMAPEQAINGKTVTPAVDVYSLGCVLFECITGTTAFAGELQQLLSRMLNGDAPRLRDVQRDAPLALDDLIGRMLQRDPGRRATLGTVSADVATFLTQGANDLGRRNSTIPAVTGDECTLIAVIVSDTLINPDDMLASTAATIESDAGSVMSVAAKFGGELTMLPNGGASITLTGDGGIDLAAHAAKCALAMRLAVGEAHVSIASGRGDPVRKDAATEILERAMLLSAAASSTQHIRVDSMTASLLDARFVVIQDGEDNFLAGEREQTAQRKLLGKETPCFGRERDLAMLSGLVAECLDEPLSTAIVITGSPGVGKSRVRQEILQALATREGAPEIWMARGDPISAAAPYGLLEQLLRRAAGIEEGDLIEVRRQKLLTRVGRHLPITDAIRVAEFFGDHVRARFVGDDRPLLRTARRDPALMTEQLRRAWDDFIAAEVASAPLAIVLEDLHWGDLQTIRLIDSALRNQRQRPLLVLSVARPEVHDVFPGLFRDRRVHEIRLAELTPSAARKLVQHLLGADADRALVEKLVERSHGNAFYLEELVRGVVEDRDTLPETVLATAQAQLQRLEPSARRLLRAASVFGTRFWLSGLGALLRADAVSDVRPALDNLIQRELVMSQPSSRFPGDEEYAFRQALVRDAAYDMLTERDRSRGHAVVAEWLEANGEKDPVVLGEHFERSGERHRAVVWFLWAAEQALAKSDWAKVVAHANRGTACGATGAVLGELNLLKAEVTGWAGSGMHLPLARAALQLLPVGSSAWARASAEVVVASGDRAIATLLAETPPDTDSISHYWARARAARAMLRAGDAALARALLAAIVKVAPHPEDAAIVGHITSWISAVIELGAGHPQPMCESAGAIAAAFEESDNARWALLVALDAARAGDADSWGERAKNLSQRLGLRLHEEMESWPRSN
jgi:hypothetical protein